MKKTFFVLCSIVLLAASCQKFDDSDLWGKVNDHESQLSDFNIPTGIVMLSQSFEDVLKDDTLYIDIRVNPSDFPLKKEHIGLMCSTHTYSVCEPGKDLEDCPFDPSAKSNFEILDIASLEGYEGGYRIVVAVNGKGNYFEDANIFVTAGAKDRQDNFRSVCSATPCQVSVIPAIEDGLLVQSPEQSFFEITDLRTGVTEQKNFLLGVWSNRYKDAEGRIKVYDRTKLGMLTICDSLAQSASVVNDYFQEYGIVPIEIDSTNTFWQKELSRYRSGEVSFTEIKSMSLGVSRDSEHKDIPFDLKVYYRSIINISDSMTVAESEAMKKKYYDVDSELTGCGIPSTGYVGPLLNYRSEISPSDGILAEFNEQSRQIKVYFGISKPLPLSFFKYVDKYSIGAQDKDGNAIDKVFLPETFSSVLLNVNINLNITFTDL